MSDPDYRENLTKWLLDNYPIEAVFIDEINKNVNELYQHSGVGRDLLVNEDKGIIIQISKRPETDYAELKMSTPAILFVGGMAKAISDVVLKEVLPKIQPVKWYLIPLSNMDDSTAS